MPTGAIPSATLPAAYGSQQTVQPGDIQNAPPSFVECISGKMLFFYTPSVSHVGSGSIVMRSATNEAAANAGTFSGVTNISNESYPYYYGLAGAAVIQNGAHRGRVWVSYCRATLPAPSLLQAECKYSDDEGVTWSAPITLPNLWVSNGVTGWQLASCPSAPIVELPNGDLILPVYGGNGNEGGDSWNKLYKSTDGGATWAYFSTISARRVGYAEGEPNVTLVTRADGSLRLVCSYNSLNQSSAYSTSVIRIVYSDDLGATWSTPADCGLGAGWGGNPAIFQCVDGSVFLLIRNVAAQAYQTFYARSTSYGDPGTFGSATSIYPVGSMRYGTWQNLKSGRFAVCFGTETSTENAGIYYRAYTPAAYTPAKSASEPVRQEAFIDGSRLDSVSGLTYRVGRPTKSASNPVLTGTPNTYQHHVVYTTAVKDPTSGDIKLFYGNKTQDWSHGRVSMAVSGGNDGVNFTKPNLGLFTLDGNTNNNCVLDTAPVGAGGTDAMNYFAFVSYHPGVGYVSVGSEIPMPNPNAGHWYAGVYTSPDGINWTLASRVDTQLTTRDAMSIIRRPDGRWVIFMQTRTGANVRSVGYWLSDSVDLATTTWSAPTDFLLTGTSLTYQYYSFGAWREGEVTYAVNCIYDGTGYYQTAPYFITTDTQDRQFKFELWSTTNVDCLTGWTRIDADWMWSGANAGALDSTPGEWDYGCMVSGAAPVKVGNDWRYYYGGAREQHHPSPPGPNGTQPWTQRQAGFASVPYRRIGGLTGTGNVVLNTVVGAAGKTLTLNSAGTVQAELLDPTTGTPITGFARANCDTIPSDTYGHTVSWAGVRTLPSSFKIKLYVTSGTVYYASVDQPTAGTLTLRSDPYWAQNGYSLTVFAPIGAPTIATCDITTAAGGYMRVVGPHAARFSLSADGTTWSSLLFVPAGSSTVYLRAISQSGDNTLTAQVGVPS